MLTSGLFNRTLSTGLLGAFMLGIAGSPVAFAQEGMSLQNEEYQVDVQPDGTMMVRGEGTPPLQFTPTFTVLSAEQDPQLEIRPASIPNVRYNVPTWKPAEEVIAEAQFEARERDEAETGDGFDPRILEGEAGGRTADYFYAAKTTEISAVSAEQVGDKITWTFPERSDFTLRAHLTARPGRGEPALHVTFKPKTEKWYSVGYTGAPAHDLEAVYEIWQPLIWQEKRFPDQSYLTAAFRGPVPTTLVTAEGTTVGVLAAPPELPFQPLPTFENSRFGMTVRNAAGRAQPALFAPILGGVESHMRPGEPYDFEMLLLAHQGDSPSAFRHVARRLFGFEDYRQNVNGHTLNATIENMIDYGLSEYSQFNDTLRGTSYATDVPGAVKNVSSLYPLSVAMITDSKRVYDERAYPMIEYMLSREKFLFTVDPEIKGQGASWHMNGPAAPLSELTALYEISGRRTPVFLQLADSLLEGERTLNLDTKVRGDRWPNLLAMYRATGDERYLERAKAGADEYLQERVERRATDFVDDFVGGDPFFWTQFTPAFIPLYDLYEETGAERYLDAALRGARQYAMFVWMAPRIPEDHTLVNEGGQAPQYWYLEAKGHAPMAAPEAFVEAWKLSAIGLTSESSSTSNGHRGIFMANPSPWLMRLAEESRDDFLHDIARSSIIGRYTNFPGYHINTERTNVFMKPDYPLRPHKELSYNSFHYNHIWPHIAMLFDYLISEAHFHSEGRIWFPAHYGEGYAYLQNKVYGDRAGHFYEADDARLWMPRGLVDTGHDQVNYVAARGEDGLYLALMNESDEAVGTTVRLNENLLSMEEGRTYPVSVWNDSTPAEDTEMEGGVLQTTVAPRGLTALAIDGVHAQTEFQQRIGRGAPLSVDSFAQLKVGGTHGALLSMGEGLTAAYVYLQATHKDIEEAHLHYKTDGDWTIVTDDSYPFEFTHDLDADEVGFEFYVEAVGPEGTLQRSETAVLQR